MSERWGVGGEGGGGEWSAKGTAVKFAVWEGLTGVVEVGAYRVGWGGRPRCKRRM